MEKNWKLWDDLNVHDDLLGGFSFKQLIDSLHAGTKHITPKSVKLMVRDMLDTELQDMWFLVDNNMDEIIAAAMKGRCK